MSDDDLTRYREALEDIGAIHGRNRWRPGREHANEYQRGWHDGYMTLAATVSTKADAALDPETRAEVDEMHDVAARGSDEDWYELTGHCGGCGAIADCCDCRGACGCWEDHGPPPRPWESPLSRAHRLREELADAVEALGLLRGVPRCLQPQTDLFGGETPCGSCHACRLRAAVTEGREGDTADPPSFQPDEDLIGYIEQANVGPRPGDPYCWSEGSP